LFVVVGIVGAPCSSVPHANISGYLINTIAANTNTQKQEAAIVRIFFLPASNFNPHKFCIIFHAKGPAFVGAGLA
jgi:hypothetical protein